MGYHAERTSRAADSGRTLLPVDDQPVVGPLLPVRAYVQCLFYRGRKEVWGSAGGFSGSSANLALPPLESGRVRSAVIQDRTAI